MNWLSSHTTEAVAVSSLIGALGASLKWFPGFWRGLAKIAIGWFLYEMERGKRIALEEQVDELLDQIETLKAHSPRRPKRGSDAG